MRQIGNALANYVGSTAALGAMLVFQAVFARMTSAEAFGMISLLLAISLILPAFDLGMGRTVGRILAESLASPGTADRLKTEVITLQIINAATGLVLGAAIVFAAEWIALDWLHTRELSVAEAAAAVALVGANVPFLMIRQFAISGLNAMQHQALANVLLTAFVLLRGAMGTVALSSDGSASSFLLSQLVANALDALVCAAFFWSLLPRNSGSIGFRLGVIRDRWRFVMGDGMTSLLGVATIHVDKVLLSALLPLSAFGAYTLIATVAAGMGRMVGPMAVAFLPHFVGVYSSGQHQRLRDEYLLATQLTSCVVFPVAATLAAFAPDIVPALLPANSYIRELVPAFALLTIAATVGNLMQLPHAIQLAAGNSVIALRFSAANALVYLLLLIALVPSLGILAPALVLCGVQGASLFLFVRTTQRLVPIPIGRWFAEGIARPAVIAVAIPVAIHWLLPAGIGPFWGGFTLLASVLTAGVGALAVSPGASRELRHFARHVVARRKAAPPSRR